MILAVVGATGMVGRKIIQVVEERKFPVSGLIAVASEKSAGKHIVFGNREIPVITPEKALKLKPDLALFSAGATVSKIWAPAFASRGCRVIDNSSFWRMDPDVKLIIPEINGHLIEAGDRIIANPNCSTIQMAVALNLLHREFRLRRIIVSTYQSVTGSGFKGVRQLETERGENPDCSTDGLSPESRAYRHRIDKNVIPQIDFFTGNGFTKEEMKMTEETQKIFGDADICVSATAVRVPVEGGHSESVYAEFRHPPVMDKVMKLLKASPGCEVRDIPSEYPMPLQAWGKDEVFVGRIRKDLFSEYGLHLWVVADNLRKGAATNAVQIAEILLSKL